MSSESFVNAFASWNLRKYTKRETVRKVAIEIIEVTLKIRFASCTLFAPIELPTRLQVAS